MSSEQTSSGAEMALDDFEAIEKAGGKVDLVPPRQTMHEKKKSEKKAKAKA